jgi:hypothetical protein
MPAPEVLLACARPADVPPRDWDELASLLDAVERERAQRLRFDADRQAYLLSHALLRALVAAESGCRAEAVRIEHDVRGRPFIQQAPELHVSLSRHRDAVACAVTRAAPVGVDVERIAGKPVDAGLLGAFVVTHESVTERQFFHQWTALEAFWKACGTGLADAQPRICCVPCGGNRFDVHMERSRFEELRAGPGRCAGRGAIVNAFDDCALALVLRAPVDPRFVLKRTHCTGAADIGQLGKAKSREQRFCAV